MNTVEQWHELMRERDPARLPEIIGEDCVFLSPVVHSPQEGRDITVLYLTGAMHVFNEGFRYTKEVVAGNHAVLEFECEIDGILINGVDIMTFNEEGKIVEFKVMVRPLKAVNMIHQQMGAMLQKLAS
ncbi:MAG: nuclear transport factor 2 family protein [Halieaceae bacterium]